MGRQIDLAEVVDGDQGVDLRGGHRGVTEQFLHHPDIGTALKQVGGEGVPQGVRGNVFSDVGFVRPAFKMVQALCRLILPPRALRNRAGVPLPLAASRGRPRTR